MTRRHWLSMTCCGLMAMLTCFGCGGGAPVQPTAGTSGGDDHGHDGHDHDGHDHDEHGHTGPNGGHLIELDPAGYHAEWAHDDQGNVTVYVLDAEAEKTVAVADGSVVIDVTIGGNTESYPLVPVPAEEDETKTGRFETTDKPLVQSLMGAGHEGIEAVVTIKIGDQTHTGKFEAHDEHGHEGHAH